MLKDSTVSAHVETDIKQEAEDILQKLGIPVSVVINSLYRQIIFTKGMDSMLQHSYEQSLAGKGRPFEEVFDELERGLA